MPDKKVPEQHYFNQDKSSTYKYAHIDAPYKGISRKYPGS
jgi:hypothetical protein